MHVLMLNDGTMICPGGLLDAVQIVGEELSQELARLIELEVKKICQETKELHLELDACAQEISIYEEKNAALEEENQVLIRRIESAYDLI